MPRPHRRPFRWPFRLALAGAAVCVLLFAISLRKTVIVGVSGYGFMLTDGGLWLIHRSDFERPEFATTDARGRVDWWPPAAYIRPNRGSLARPEWSLDARLWFLAGASLLAAGGVVLASRVLVGRRRRAGRCTGCGFDLSATPAAQPCPECGLAR